MPEQALEQLEQRGRQLEEVNRRLAEMARLCHEEAERAEERAVELDAIIESMNEGVVVSDEEKRIVRINEQELKLLGLRSRDEMPSALPFLACFNPRTPEGVPIEADHLPGPRAFRGESFTDMELVIDAADGQEKHLVVTGAPVRDSGGRIILAVTLARDVTQLRRTEREREDWVRMVSHDLRSPLTVVLGQSQLLQRLADRPEAVERSAEAVITAARRMNSMIQDLTDVARLEMGKLQPSIERIDLLAFLRAHLAAYAPGAGPSRIQLETTPNLAPVAADPNWLARVLDNLLSNALKYSTPATSITVRLSGRDAQVACEVTDQGPGIGQEDLSHIFERYFRGDRPAVKKEGLGMGLYITRLFVKAMGGRVWAESKVGVGSTFGFSLPTAGSS